MAASIMREQLVEGYSPQEGKAGPGVSRSWSQQFPASWSPVQGLHPQHTAPLSHTGHCLHMNESHGFHSRAPRRLKQAPGRSQSLHPKPALPGQVTQGHRAGYNPRGHGTSCSNAGAREPLQTWGLHNVDLSCSYRTA